MAIDGFAETQRGERMKDVWQRRAVAASVVASSGVGDLAMTLVLADGNLRGCEDPIFASHLDPIYYLVAIWKSGTSGLDAAHEFLQLSADDQNSCGWICQYCDELQEWMCRDVPVSIFLRRLENAPLESPMDPSIMLGLPVATCVVGRGLGNRRKNGWPYR